MDESQVKEWQEHPVSKALLSMISSRREEAFRLDREGKTDPRLLKILTPSVGLMEVEGLLTIKPEVICGLLSFTSSKE
jgi:hypothetical protein